MKNLQSNLLIVLACALCGLCGYQWYSQTLQRNKIQELAGQIYQQSVTIRDQTNSIAAMNHQIAQMDARMTELKAAGSTNEGLVVVQQRELGRLRAVSDGLTRQVAEYKSALD